MIKHAVIIAAGENLRIRNLANNQPKAFLKLGGISLIQRSINLLKNAGIELITIVAGYQADHFYNLSKKTEKVEILLNPNFANSGSLLSLYLAKNILTSPFLLLESDLIYERRALTSLQSDPNSNVMLISGYTKSGDEVFVSKKGKLINGISKNRNTLDNICGELVGISKFDPKLCKVLFNYSELLFEQQGYDFHYEEGISKISSIIDVNYCKIENLVWAEIDNEDQFRRAEKEIIPRLSSGTNIP